MDTRFLNDKLHEVHPDKVRAKPQQRQSGALCREVEHRSHI
jgi:hypothetical protein